MDKLVADGVCGLLHPVLPGITTGSGPGHLALFGYDPMEYVIGRGVLSALGIDFDLWPTDVAARGNFCTLDEDGNVIDRRAERLPSEEGKRLVEKLRQIQLDDVELFVEPVREYRLTVVFRGEGLAAEINDTDPQATGIPPHEPKARNQKSQRTEQAVREFLQRARKILRDEHPANMINLRGFAQRPDWPTFPDIYGLRGAAIATYPMYRGLARLLGLEVVVDTHADLDGQVRVLEENWDRFDFFFLHYKYTDSTGEDGDFGGKVKRIEELDQRVSHLMRLEPDVLIVTGDHSTPSRLRNMTDTLRA